MSNPNYLKQMPLITDDILENIILLYDFNIELQKKLNKPITFDSSILDNYYAITSEWINKFKEFYNYELISGIIQNNYNEFKNNKEKIIQEIKKCK